MLPRVAMLLLVLMSPASSLAATICCDEVATDSCCEPEGGCPISEDGACAVAVAGEAFRAPLPASEPPIPGPARSAEYATAASPPAIFPPHAREPARTPRFLLLQTLRH
jgi:hypothetical protein